MNYCLHRSVSWRSEMVQKYGVRLVEAPTSEPISGEDVFTHLRLDAMEAPEDHPDYAMVMAQLGAAREWCEAYAGIAMAPQTVEMAGSAFSSVMTMQFGPVQSIESVIYIDAEGQQQTVDDADYEFDRFTWPTVLVPTYGNAWPTARSSLNSVKVRYVAGYSAAEDDPQDFPLPFAIRAAILLMLGHLYEHRENSDIATLRDIPSGARSLLDRYRIRLGMA